MDFNFYMPTKVISKKGCLKENGFLLKSLGNRCLIITGKSSAIISGALADAEKVLKDSSIEYLIYDKVKPNPLLSGCFEAGAMARKFRADFVIGIGGGSAMDSSKAAAIFAGNSSFTPLDIYKRKIQKALPIVVVGTTAGTGSEVTAAAVITIDEENEKKAITNNFCYPKISFCDPSYTSSCSYELTVSAALDALCHAFEGFYSIRCGDIARNSALNAVNLIWPNILKLKEHTIVLPSEDERAQLYFGSLWAGLTLNLCGTCFPHALSYPLSTDFGIPHGKACAVFLADFVEKNCKVSGSVSNLIFSVMGCTSDDFCRVIRDFSKLNGVTMTKEQIDNYSTKLEGDKHLISSVVPITTDDVRNIYTEKFLRH